MSDVELFNGGVTWTINGVFSGKLNKSRPFVLQSNGEDVTFTLTSAYVASCYLELMSEFHMRGDGSTLFLSDKLDRQVAICFRSQIPIHVVPNLQLMANNGLWINLPVNWFGPNGTTSDKLFFGSTKFLHNGTLRDYYMANNYLKVKFTLVPSLESNCPATADEPQIVAVKKAFRSIELIDLTGTKSDIEVINTEMTKKYMRPVLKCPTGCSC